MRSQMEIINEAYHEVMDMISSWAPQDIVEKEHRQDLLVVLNDLYNAGYNRESERRIDD